MELRYLSVRTPNGNCPAPVYAVREDKRGLLVEVPEGVCFDWKNKTTEPGDRFYVAPRRARKGRA